MIEKCLRSICRELEVCYVYLPKTVSIEKCFLVKPHLYKKLNNSLVFFMEQSYDEIKSLLIKLTIDYIVYCAHSFLSKSVYVIIEFKTHKTTYKYTAIYIPQSFALITPSTVIKNIISFEEISKIVIEDFLKYNSSSCRSINYVKFLIPLPTNEDKISLKYRCRFSCKIIDLIILNAIMLLFYINCYAIVCRQSI